MEMFRKVVNKVTGATEEPPVVVQPVYVYPAPPYPHVHYHRSHPDPYYPNAPEIDKYISNSKFDKYQDDSAKKKDSSKKKSNKQAKNANTSGVIIEEVDETVLDFKCNLYFR